MIACALTAVVSVVGSARLQTAATWQPTQTRHRVKLTACASPSYERRLPVARLARAAKNTRMKSRLSMAFLAGSRSDTSPTPDSPTSSLARRLLWRTC